MKAVTIVHDLVVAMLAGGLATASVAAFILFDRAPSKEIAGQIGQTIFEIVGRGTFALALVLLACRLILARGDDPRVKRRAAMVMTALIVVVAAVIALWVTPALGEIWREGRHAEDGSGLAGADKEAFMARHGLGSAGYLVLILTSMGLIAMRAVDRA